MSTSPFPPSNHPTYAVLIAFPAIPLLSYIGFFAQDSPIKALAAAHKYAGTPARWIVQGLGVIHAIEAMVVAGVCVRRGYSVRATANWIIGTLLFGVNVSIPLLKLGNKGSKSN
ncbi:hypothetical protein BC828DRAFT_403540 [Blastocladiella britannica]|nr:hypothetical protein BC828DRAFT_403540 [Blastocladiella britannica]